MVKTVMSAMVMALVAANDEAALSASADSTGHKSPSKNIVELAESVPTLSTLVAAVVAGDLAETLSQPGPFTVFAPTNDAFNALPEGVLNSLMKPANKDLLSDILKFHVLPYVLTFNDDYAIRSELPTLYGDHRMNAVKLDQREFRGGEYHVREFRGQDWTQDGEGDVVQGYSG